MGGKQTYFKRLLSTVPKPRFSEAGCAQWSFCGVTCKKQRERESERVKCKEGKTVRERERCHV